MPTKAVIFDAYGTLFDIHAPTAKAAAVIGDPNVAAALGKTWRDKQLQYSWLLSLMGAVKPFWDVTQDALDYALEAHGLQANAGLKRSLLDLYFEIDCYDDVLPLFDALGGMDAGPKTAVLSNGSRNMLDAAAKSSGLSERLDALLSVEAVGIFKPDGRVYALAEETFGHKASEMTFVSCNGWDAWAAAHYGFQTVWLNRFGLPEERLPGAPKAIITTLLNLPDLL